MRSASVLEAAADDWPAFLLPLRLQHRMAEMGLSSNGMSLPQPSDTATFKQMSSRVQDFSQNGGAVGKVNIALTPRTNSITHVD